MRLSFFGNVGYIDGGIDEDNSFAPEFSGARFRLQPEWQAVMGIRLLGTGAEDVSSAAREAAYVGGYGATENDIEVEMLKRNRNGRTSPSRWVVRWQQLGLCWLCNVWGWARLCCAHL